MISKDLLSKKYQIGQCFETCGESYVENDKVIMISMRKLSKLFGATSTEEEKKLFGTRVIVVWRFNSVEY